MGSWAKSLGLIAALAAGGCYSEPDSYVAPEPAEPAKESPKNDPQDDQYDQADEEIISVVEILPPDSKGSVTPGSLPDCADAKRHFAVAKGGVFSWTVVKADGSPVVGNHQPQGELVLATTDPLAAPALSLDFNRTGDFTGLELRDQRLGETFFGAGPDLRFTLESVTTPDGQLSLPESGSSRNLILKGSLAVAGVTVKVEVPVVLAQGVDGLHVTQGAGTSYKLRTDWGVSVPLDALLALAGAKMDETATLKFDLGLAETCRPKAN